MKHIYVVRHAQAEGQEPDAKLTQLGIRQSEKLAEFFMDKEVDYIVSSPFERACATIRPFAEQRGIGVQVDDRLAERVLSSRNLPAWREMLSKTYVDLDLCYEGGESSRTAMQRALGVVTEIRSSRYSSAVIVSHGNLISLLLKCYDHRMGFKEWELLTNPDVYRLSFSEGLPGIQRIWNP
ncbi:histidine phosphatase family protein [Paenibacillus sp. S-38]|uniref:histidine phosphatase family protein n=1 Tax=Paenibacillus sp. S-38 TaxID=3416710 RepID=UPI003CEF8B1B